jgi:hypothetical protein
MLIDKVMLLRMHNKYNDKSGRKYENYFLPFYFQAI